MCHPAPSVWFCDACGEPVDEKNGNVEWSKGKDYKHPGREFKIVHRERSCTFRNVHDGDTYMYLKDFVAPGGYLRVIEILEEFSDTQLPFEAVDDLVALMRRLYIPYWEIARGKLISFARAHGQDTGQIDVNDLTTLKQIAEWEE